MGHYSFYKSDIAKTLDYKTYDILGKLVDTSFDKSNSSNVIVIDVDEKSLNELGQWPWPRIVLAKVLEKINSYYPSAIGADVIFSERDRTSPKEINLFYKDFFDVDTLFYGIPDSFQDNDLIFSSALKKTRSVIGIYLSKTNINNKECNKLNSLDINIENFKLNSFNHILCNTKSLKSSAQYSGFVNSFFR